MRDKPKGKLGTYLFMLSCLHIFKLTAQETDWVKLLNHTLQGNTYTLELYEPVSDVWEARVISYNSSSKSSDTLVLDIQTDLGMLTGDFSFRVEDKMLFLKYEFIHHNATIVTQVFNLSQRKAKPVEFKTKSKN